MDSDIEQYGESPKEKPPHKFGNFSLPDGAHIKFGDMKTSLMPEYTSPSGGVSVYREWVETR